MPATQQTHTLGKTMQLFDLNKDVTNFRVKFAVKSTPDDSPFEAVVVDQTLLNNPDQIKYQQAPGFINGEIVNDNNIYQSYWLLLRSENPTQVTVDIDLTEIPGILRKPVEAPKSWFEQWKWPILCLGIIAVAIVGFYLYNKKSSKAISWGNNSNKSDSLFSPLDYAKNIPETQTRPEQTRSMPKRPAISTNTLKEKLSSLAKSDKLSTPTQVSSLPASNPVVSSASVLAQSAPTSITSGKNSITDRLKGLPL